MGQLLVRGLSEMEVEELRKAAKEHARSLESEARTILREAINRRRSRARGRRELTKFRKELAGRTFSDPTALIREDRENDSTRR